MTGIFASKATAGKPRCARCKRPFTPKSTDQKYGPHCAQIVAGQIDVSALDHVDRTDAGGEPHYNEDCEGYGCRHPSHTVIV